MAEIKKAAIVARVSTSNGTQDPMNQIVPCREMAKALGYEVVGEYVDYCSGGRSDREHFQKMLVDSDKGKFTLLIFWSLDRLSREGIPNTLGYLQRLKRNAVAVKSIQESWLDTRDEGIGQLLLAIFSWVAQQERKRIVERIYAGLERAKSEGKRLGRPMGSKDKRERRRSGYWLRYAQTS